MPKVPEGQVVGRYGDAFDFICSVAENHSGYELIPAGKDNVRTICPAHDDEYPSLSIGRGSNPIGTVVVYCHTGCSFGEIRDAWELRNRDFEPADRRHLRSGRELKKAPSKWVESLDWPVVETYVYELDGKPVFRKLRMEPEQQPTGKRLKTFKVERLENNRWQTGLLPSTPRVLYRQDELDSAYARDSSNPILFVEGEKDVEAARSKGYTATCNFDGANGKWVSAYSEALAGAGSHIWIVRDKDPAGHKHAEMIASHLGIKTEIREAKLDQPGADLSDHFDVGYELADLVKVRDVTPKAASWAPQNPDAVLEGEYTRLEPTLLSRNDGNCLLYPGKTHWISGEPESGKSWIAMIAAAQVLRDPAGGRVLYLDYEDDLPEVINRMLALGVSREVLRFDADRFRYVQPQVGHDREQDAFRDLLAQHWSLVILDAVTEALSTEGKSGREENELADWANKVVKPFAQRTGAAVVCIDHVVKSTESRGRWAIGSQHKLAVLSGAAYSIEVSEEIAPGQTGSLLMWVSKDRIGAVRRFSSNWDRSTKMKLAARVVLDATDPAAIIAQVWEPKEDDQDTRPSWASGRSNLKQGSEPELTDEQIEKRILQELEVRGPSSQNYLERAIPGRAVRVREAVSRLLERGSSIRDAPNKPIRLPG